ncbi:MAG TPA: hypothetical protein VI958_03180, partial [Acidobacteriota bacterium]
MKSFSLRHLYFSPTVLLLIAAFAHAQASYKEIDVKSGGVIRGRVLLRSKDVSLPKITINKDSSVCGNAKDNPTLIVGKTGGVKNSIVYLEGITQGKTMGELMKAELDQVQCEYEPHVLIVPSGSKVDILNSDSVLHSVHAYDLTGASSTGLPTVFNIALPLKGQRIPKQLASGRLLLNLCDAGHPWMNSYVMPANHPYYAVTDEEGNFVLDNVPAGTYTIKMWHEPVLHISEKTGSHDYLKSKESVVTKKVTV